MEPLSIYLIGVLLTGLAAPVAGVTSVSAGTLALTWPVSVPALAGYGAMRGISHVLTPREPEQRDLIALNSKPPTAGQYVYCNIYPVPIADIEKEGGFHAFSAGRFPLEKLDSPLLKVAGKSLKTATNWRAGTVFHDSNDAIPKLTADWVGNYTNDAGQPVADLRVCSLKNKSSGVTK